eukprot:10509147-Alexandrium_andersonii.AAC.1
MALRRGKGRPGGVTGAAAVSNACAKAVCVDLPRSCTPRASPEAKTPPSGAPDRLKRAESL